MTFLAVWICEGIAMLLVNDRNHSTRCLVAYSDDHPVRIRYQDEP